MIGVNETAYPRLKAHPTAKELASIYTPSVDEIAFANTHARRPAPRTGFLILLKTFQRLGYFSRLADVPQTIVSHIAKSIGFDKLPNGLHAYDESNARLRHLNLILAFLRVTPYDKASEAAMIAAVTEAASTKDDLADIINVAIEELVRQRCELPSFATILRAAKKARVTVNGGYHKLIYQELGKDGRKKIDVLFAKGSRNIKCAWDKVKREPQRPTVGHMREFTEHLRWLRDFAIKDESFVLIPDVKIRQFAAEAKSLDAASMRDLAEKKRYAIAATLIRLQTAHALDDLAEMFVKRMQKLHRLGKEALDQYHLRNIDQTQSLVAMLRKVIVAACKSEEPTEKRLEAITTAVGADPDKILEQCEAYGAHAGGNYLAFLPRIFKGSRSALYSLLEGMPLITTSSDKSVILAVAFLLQNRRSKGEWLHNTAAIDLSWVADKWWPLVAGPGIKPGTKPQQVSRRYFEICLFTQVMQELKSGDLAISSGDRFGDYRHQLLSWEEFERERAIYGEQVGLPMDGKAFVDQMRKKMAVAAEEADKSFPDNEAVRLVNGEPAIAKLDRRAMPAGLAQLDQLMAERMSPINIVEILADTDHWLRWTKHFGPLSGHDAKIENPRERYIVTTFCYGCNLGPSQTARSIKGFDRRQVSLVNQRHATDGTLEEATVEVINAYNRFTLPKLWGTGKHASADGTKWDLYEQNLLSEYHIRYGGYGGIGYYHVSDTYIALFSHFIPCGVWEAVHILDGLLQNRSDIQPDTLHGDTQAQSAPVFALSHLLGIKLMPRIRNWKDLKFFRPEKGARYEHINELFDEAIDWDLIETHFHDMLRVAVSIKAGHITAATVLRRLGVQSRKNKVYFAFRELGRAIRTIFLLSYIGDAELRRTIQAATNKSEAFNGFAQWVAFGGGGVIAENDRDEQRKVIKYNHLVSSLVILHTVNEMSKVLGQLKNEGHEFSREALAALSPYRREHINRFGDYTVNLDKVPDPLSYKVFEASLEA
ncbi:MAG TPA: Tn3 family transposase [Oligoflexus sp.]|uniref:Tn3 family transposase n=1 Tax=Oligoflexus sp. TaxID=1971216 RepID=UPI002D7FCD36|nr:Tn3 family transposase [Oligoflexus sp.]HET9239221.1 Tn3 family transposase [Oligoflexus sp.]